MRSVAYASILETVFGAAIEKGVLRLFREATTRMASCDGIDVTDIVCL